MPRVILTSRYLKPSRSGHRSYLVKYIATRPGAESITASDESLHATKNQEQLIAKIIIDFPDAIVTHEYADYISAPTVKNATGFITQTLENNIDRISNRKNYVDYVANRPRVERIGAHGLFTDEGLPIVLAQVADDVATHPGNVWTTVISLRREDAARLRYDNAEAWMGLIRSKRSLIAENMKIGQDNLRWYAGFHNESHHPHVHLIAYSTNPKEGYLTEKGIENLRAAFAREIFRDDLISVYKKQTERRSAVNEQAKQSMDELLAQMRSGVCINKQIESDILLLTERLRNTGGKKVYGYLKPDIKAIVDRIVDGLADLDVVVRAYGAWYEMRNEILLTYTDKLPDPVPLSQQKDFKIRQIVINEAMRIVNGELILETDEREQVAHNATEDALPGEPNDDGSNDSFQEIDDYIDNSNADYNADWTDRYKLARRYLFGSADNAPDFDSAYKLFMEEAETGNALAMHDLGRMHMDGIGREIDTIAAHEWYAKALAAFIAVENNKPNPYIEYRIGKLHYAGYGTPKDYNQAVSWFEKAVEQSHKYAQYSLAGMYYRGQGVTQDYIRAFNLYEASADQHNAYAAYELAKMLRDGIGTAADDKAAAVYFKAAFDGFVSMEADSKDDKLQYRIGQMLYTGTGVEKDIGKAIEFFEKSAKLGNVYAQYMLAKIYMKDDMHVDVEKALVWMHKAAESGNPMAQYALAKLYLTGSHVEKDVAKSVELLTKSAEQGNEYAQYNLGKLFLKGEDVSRDISSAIKWLTAAAGQGNQYAQYALGKLYLGSEDFPKDINSAIKWLTEAVEQKNQYAQYALGKLYLKGEDVPQDINSAIKWLTAVAEQGNQYAQYALGKLYLIDSKVEQDKEKAAYWFSLSAAQGNTYAQYFIDHMNDYEPSALFMTVRLLNQLSGIFENETHQMRNKYHTDSKARRKEREKKMAQGHKPDDYAPEQTL